MWPRGPAPGRVVPLLLIGLACAVVRAQPATQAGKGPFQLSLADVNVCLDTLSGIDKAPAVRLPAPGRVVAGGVN